MSIRKELKRLGVSVKSNSLWSFPGAIRASNIGSLGNVFYVDSNDGTDDTAHGFAPGSSAFATIDYAVGRCTANNGDVIYVMPGHAETISTATGLVVDVAGVSIIGVGTGALRPTLTLSASASTVSITAANCVFQGFLLISSFTGGVAVGITAAATALNLQLLDIEMQETTNAKEWLIGVSIGAACHGVLIDGFKYYGLTGGGTTQAIKFVGASNYSVVKNFLIYGDFSGAAIDALTAASVWMTIGNGVLHNLDTAAGLSVSVKSDTTGFIHDLRISQLKDTVGPAGAAMAASEVYVSNAIFTQGIFKPVADS